MNFNATRIPYRETGYFSGIVLDYLDHAEALKPFFNYTASLNGIQKAIEARKKFPIDRNKLVAEIKKQYEGVDTSSKAVNNIVSLLSEKTFTITTAHQPNIFTGPLYFIYKILHAIKLAELCKQSISGYEFVPVFWMGSEDADLDELGHINLGGKKLEWKTMQSGAVGRMKIDKDFLSLIRDLEGQLNVQPFGKEITTLVKECFKEGVLIQDATFHFLNALFGEYGLVVLIPDNEALKKQMIPVFEDDMLNETASGIVAKTAERLQVASYKQQVSPREINLFYLKDNIRERIIKQSESYKVQGTSLSMSEEELKKELYDHPDLFSPNVILRGIYQESILPNIVFIGGGGEIAYWLQLKELFHHYNVHFPVLILRNSFELVEKKWQEKISRLGFTPEDFFLPELELVKRLVEKESRQDIKLNGVYSDTEEFYDKIKAQATNVDSSLAKHVDALKKQSLQRLKNLEKKMLRAEKRKYSEQQRQIHTIKENLFPQNGLQERSENMMNYYSLWGKELFQMLYKHSLGMEQEFVVMNES